MSEGLIWTLLTVFGSAIGIVIGQTIANSVI